MCNLKPLSFFRRNSLFGLGGLVFIFGIFTSMFFFLNTTAVNAETCDVKNCKLLCDKETEDSDKNCKSVCTDPAKPEYCILRIDIDPSSTPTTPQSVSISFSNPLKYGTVDEVLSAILMGLRGVIIALSLVFIVLGGVFYIVSMGDSGKLTTAKNMITAALIGLAIALLAPTFLKEIYDFLGGKNQGFAEPAEVTNALSAAAVLLNVLNFLLSIVGVIAIIMLVIGGIAFFTAAGDTSKVTTAKKIITFALIGITVALASLVIVRQLANFFVT